MNTLEKKLGQETGVNATAVRWIKLETELQMEEIKSNSNQKLQLIFKHSTRCIISKMALKQFEKEYDFADQMDLYLLDLLQNRDISNQIATNYDIQHQSPQLILIQNSKAIYNVSHENIEASTLKNYLFLLNSLLNKNVFLP